MSDAVRAMRDQRAVALEAPVPVDDLLDGLAEVLVIADGHVHGVDAALAHLLKDLRRPVAVLAAVDGVGLGHVGSSRMLSSAG